MINKLKKIWEWIVIHLFPIFEKTSFWYLKITKRLIKDKYSDNWIYTPKKKKGGK